MSAELRKLLVGDFENGLYEAAYRNLGDALNPIRFNNFAYALRELIRNLNERLAPDENVLKCGWYKNLTKHENGISRSQRAYYSVQGGISDDFLINVLGLDTTLMHKRLTKAIDKLSKFTHIQPETFSIDAQHIGALTLEIEDAINGLCSAIAECRGELVESVIEKIDRVLVNQTLSETIASIDRIAPHHSVNEVYVDDIELISIDHEQIIFQAAGIIAAELQWGSNSDVRKGDGMRMHDEFPFQCQLVSNVENPIDLTVLEGTFEVDTASWDDSGDDI